MGCLSCSSLKQLAIPGVYLPRKEIFSNHQTFVLLSELSYTTSKHIIKWASDSSFIRKLNGTSKQDDKLLKEFQKAFVDEVLENKEVLPNKYEYFGTEKNEKNLSSFLKHNPFFSSALVSKTDTNTGKNYYEIITHNAITDKTWFSEIVDCLDPSYIRINAKFDENLKIIGIEGYQNGLLFKPSDDNYLYSYLLLLFFYYSECVHAIIHVYHLVLVAGLADSIHHSKTMTDWGKQYYPHVYLKHQEVEILLFGEGGALVGGDFKADRNKILSICYEIIKIWGNCKSSNDFIKNFLLYSCYKNQNFKLESSGLIEEFRKQSALSVGYAEELNNEFIKLDSGKDLAKCNENFGIFFPECGNQVFKIDNIKQWIELMTTTGILHSFTLSFTRLVFKPSILKLFRPNLENYNGADVKTLQFTSGTIVGSIEDKEVYCENLLSEDLNSPGIRVIVKKYKVLSEKLKLDHFERIKRLPDFNEIGWILTDCGVSGVDGKQLTITTYI